MNFLVAGRPQIAGQRREIIAYCSAVTVNARIAVSTWIAQAISLTAMKNIIGAQCVSKTNIALRNFHSVMVGIASSAETATTVLKRNQFALEVGREGVDTVVINAVITATASIATSLAEFVKVENAFPAIRTAIALQNSGVLAVGVSSSMGAYPSLSVVSGEH